MMFQPFNLFPHLTVLQNLTLAPLLVRRWSGWANARSLCMNPQLMLFNEPTSAPDTEMVREVVEVAHSVVLMDAGELVEVAPTLQFFSSPSQQCRRRFLEQIL